MTNVNDLPNCLALHGDVTLGFRFGEVRSVTPVNLPGNGHHPHIRVRYRGGLTVDYSPAAATELARRFPEALAHMPEVPECSGATADLGGES